MGMCISGSNLGFGFWIEENVANLDNLASRCSGCVLDTNLDQPPVMEEVTEFFLKQGVAEFTLESGNLVRAKEIQFLLVHYHMMYSNS
jgi:hypothetical protein